MRGSFTALITPFYDGKVDYASLERLLDLQLRSGIEGVVVLGTTGESPTLLASERREIIRFVVKLVRGRMQVVVGTGTNATKSSVERSREAEDLGADACMLVAPYYNKPTQEGLVRHFEAVSQAVGIELMLYNIPSRTGVTITNEVFDRLAEHKNITAVKDAVDSIEHTSEFLSRHKDRYAVFSGNDGLNYSILVLGGVGVVSVLSNVFPNEVVAMNRHVARGELEKARSLHQRLWPVFKAFFCRTNPIPVKAAAKHLGMVRSNEVRLPLVALDDEAMSILKASLKGFDLESQHVQHVPRGTINKAP